jgi:DNA-binding transcriptional regulator GbsR (MarR family)
VSAPFEKIFGDTSELRVIQFLLPMNGLEFNISEMARGADVSRQALNNVVKKLLKWNVLKITSKHGNANYYALNENSGFIEAFENLNNLIIEQMLGEETLAEIADYSLERCIQIQPVEDSSPSN